MSFVLSPMFDLLSDQFSPLDALVAPLDAVRLPDPTARPLDYLGKCRSLLPADDPNYLSLLPSRKPAAKPTALTPADQQNRPMNDTKNPLDIVEALTSTLA